MRRFAFLGGAAAVLLGTAVALAAASPSPSPSATAKPSATPHPSASPSASTTPAPTTIPKTTTTEPSFSATVHPLQISGSANVVEASGGTGTVTLRVTGLLDAQRWTVDIDAGTIARPNERVEIAFKTGADVTRLATDTVRIHLTKTEMAAFLKARTSGGVVAEVSDGMRVGYAEFAGA